MRILSAPSGLSTATITGYILGIFLAITYLMVPAVSLGLLVLIVWLTHFCHISLLRGVLRVPTGGVTHVSRYATLHGAHPQVMHYLEYTGFIG